MITQSELKEWLSYDEQSGQFLWKKGRGHNGNVAGSIKRGYVVIVLLGKAYQAHRLAWLYVHGVFPSMAIDHINRKKSDNRMGNLREATSSMNTNNSIDALKGSKYGVRNVLWHKKDKRWVVHFRRGDKFVFHRSFIDFDEAVKVARQMKKELHPEAFSCPLGGQAK